MPTKVIAAPEKFFECEVKRRRLRAGGRGYEPFWKTKTVADAVVDGDTEFRCKDCHGSLKLVHRKSAQGLVAYVEHKSRVDAEYCNGSKFFQDATDGRTARLSATPIQ